MLVHLPQCRLGLSQPSLMISSQSAGKVIKHRQPPHPWSPVDLGAEMTGQDVYRRTELPDEDPSEAGALHGICALWIRADRESSYDTTVSRVLTATHRGLLEFTWLAQNTSPRPVCRCGEVQSSARRRSFSALRRTIAHSEVTDATPPCVLRRRRHGAPGQERLRGPLAVDGMRSVPTDVHAP